ncbi:MAG TPA: exo-alpha-sialidase [Opitutaceae bacterium]|nr:exo-alpha-sialidase [Opitutaceae bacterium]
MGALVACTVLATSAVRAVNISERKLVVDVRELATPAAAGSLGTALAQGPDGMVFLAWMEPAAARGWALKFATLDAYRKSWSEPRLIAQGSDLRADAANTPALAVQTTGRMLAVWPVASRIPAQGATHTDTGHLVWSQSNDGGTTWSAPQPLSRESEITGFVTAVPLADGRFLAAWLDGRAKSSDQRQLFSRIVGRESPDQLVDPTVCAGSPLALVPFPDGSASLAYRGRIEGGIRDHLIARFNDDQWEVPPSVGREGWKATGSPANAPRLAADGPRMGEAWFTAADDEPRVLVSTSPDAGSLWTMAQRADLGHPAGRVDTLLLHDGSQYVLWLEDRGEDDSQPAGIYLRRYNGFGGAMIPARLAPDSPAQVSGVPRLALVKEDDVSGPAQLLLVYTQAGTPTHVRTLLATLPSTAELMDMDSDCACSAGKEIVAGYAVKGRVLTVDAEGRRLQVQHGPIPGLMRTGELTVRVAPMVAAAVQPGREFLARLEKRGGEWWIFNVRLLGEK